MANIYINMHRGTGADVEVHREDCNEARKILRAGAGDDAGPVVESTLVGIWEEYNEDFISEAKHFGVPMNERAWPMDVYPCTGVVKTRTYIDDYPKA